MFVLNGKTLASTAEFEWSLDGSDSPESMVKTRCQDATPEQLAAGGVTIEADPPVEPPEPVCIRITKSTILARLNAAGKLADAKAALDAGDLYTRERWYAPDAPFVYADAPEAIGLCKAIGADPAVILAADTNQ